VADLAALVGVAVVLFVATNIDDLLVLVAFFADPAYRARQVVVGQFLGMAALIAASVAGSLLAFVAPGEYIGLLGVVPFGLGVAKLLSRDDDDEGTARGGSRVLAVALVTIANGGDNVGAYVPVFATRSAVEATAIVLTFLALTAAMCVIGHALVSHPRVGPRIRSVVQPLIPFVLMAVGVLIVIESGAYRIAYRW
jgi:cadmium resistance protein CadD (predicted permease)